MAKYPYFLKRIENNMRTDVCFYEVISPKYYVEVETLYEKVSMNLYSTLPGRTTDEEFKENSGDGKLRLLRKFILISKEEYTEQRERAYLRISNCPIKKETGKQEEDVKLFLQSFEQAIKSSFGAMELAQLSLLKKYMDNFNKKFSEEIEENKL